MVTNEEVRAATGQQSTENILRDRRLLVWTCAVDVSPAYTTASIVLGGSWVQEGPAQPRSNWMDWISTIKKDLQKMGLTWEEAVAAALNREELHRYVCGPMLSSRRITHTHLHTLTHYFPGEPGIASCALDFPSPFVSVLCILLGQSISFHSFIKQHSVVANTMTPQVVVINV